MIFWRFLIQLIHGLDTTAGFYGGSSGSGYTLQMQTMSFSLETSNTPFRIMRSYEIQESGICSSFGTPSGKPPTIMRALTHLHLLTRTRGARAVPLPTMWQS